MIDPEQLRAIVREELANRTPPQTSWFKQAITEKVLLALLALMGTTNLFLNKTTQNTVAQTVQKVDEAQEEVKQTRELTAHRTEEANRKLDAISKDSRKTKMIAEKWSEPD